MKKIFFILLILDTLPLHSYCQCQFGIKGGYNYYQIFDNTVSDPTLNDHSFDPDRNSYLFGISFKGNVKNQPAMAYELAYRSYSFGIHTTYNGLGNGSSIDFHYNIGYLFLTLSEEFAFGSKYKFYIKPGIYYNRLIYSTITGIRTRYAWSGNPISDTIKGESDEGLCKDGFGIKAGIGLEIPMSKHLNIFFDNTYSLQLGTKSSLWGETSASFFNASFEIGVSYKFNKFPFFNKQKKV